jgi:hypothetical protein
MPSDDGWTWKFTPRGADQFESLDPHVHDCIVLSRCWKSTGLNIEAVLALLTTTEAIRPKIAR